MNPMTTRSLTFVSILNCYLTLAWAQASGEKTNVQRRGGRPERMTITHSGSRTPSKGPEVTFTGNVSVAPLFPATSPSRTSGGQVTFEPGARSAWHTHPLGQIL